MLRAAAIRETSNYSNIKVQFALKASLTSMSEKASHLQKFVHLAFIEIELVTFSFAWLTVICQLTILSDLDGLLIKFSINCDLNKVVKLSNYCIYKSTANAGHFWMHTLHTIAIMICSEIWNLMYQKQIVNIQCTSNNDNNEQDHN